MAGKGESMAHQHPKEFWEERARLNELVFRYAGQATKRFFRLDSQVYEEGALPRKTKELMGLVASLVLRCDDCIRYHLVQCYRSQVSDPELEEAMAIGLIVGGSIVIPHLRRAWQFWEDLKRDGDPSKSTEGHGGIQD